LWNIHEVRIFDGGRELPRNAQWRLTARPDPWGVADIIDGKLITFWVCGHTMQPGQFVEIDFGQTEAVDSVDIETAPNQFGLRLKLDGRDADGGWRRLALAPEILNVPTPDLRQAAAEELKRQRIDYVLLFDEEFGADDFRRNAPLWGVQQAGEYRGARLYKLP
jgi:hypothetical protein